jgi:dipeptidyl aminopeptidase/acylaminoacyl peptidase
MISVQRIGFGWRLAQQLQKLGRVYELIVYAEDGHILAHNQEDRDRRATGWFKRFIK